VYYTSDQSPGIRGGVSVFAPIQPLVAGHRYVIAGQLQEFGGESEVINTAYIVDEGSVGVPAATLQTVAVLSDTTTDMGGSAADPDGSVLTGEDYECMLVKVHDVQVTEDRTIGQSFFVAGPIPSCPDTILVSNLSGVLNSYTPPSKWSRVDVTGVLHFSSGTFRICPRSASDITSATTGVGDGGLSASVEFSVAPNPARTSTISFALPKHDQVSLGIYDLAGRQIIELAKGSLPAGQYTRKWNGTDATGQRVNPGVYFYRLKVGSELRTVRGVLLQ
jgi:FlgD Ig-like domain